jgi:hypothetical protein
MLVVSLVLRRMDSGLALRAPRNDGVETRVIAPCLVRPQGTPVILVPFPLKGRAERLGGKPRPRRPHVFDACEHPACLSARGQWFNPSPKNE